MRMHVGTLGTCLLLALGCGSPLVNAGPDSGSAGQDAGPPPVVDAGQPGEGLPCDVHAFLVQNCGGCHGEPPQGGAVGRLLSRGDLLAPSPYMPNLTMGARAVERMSASAGTMPPAPTSPLAPGEQFVLASWVDAGMPEGSCAPGPAPTLCSSNIKWIFGNVGSSLMNPGMACIACHASEWDAPKYTAAGTVYPSAHEQDTCRGTPAVTVRITDANGTEYVATSNQAGNFFFRQAIALPYRAQVESGGRIRAMATPQTSGDCNSCHAEQGTGNTPGRVMAP